MPSSTVAIALIRREGQGHTQWLARWSRDSNAFNFVGGLKGEKESFRECVICEVIAGLGLEPEADFVVDDAPQSQLEYLGLIDGTYGGTTCKLELYPVELVGDFSHEKIESDAANRWLIEAEIQTGITKDGKPISGTMNLLLRLAGLLQTGSSDESDHHN